MSCEKVLQEIVLATCAIRLQIEGFIVPNLLFIMSGL